eukprot:587071-Amphidinium_carterae.1
MRDRDFEQEGTGHAIRVSLAHVDSRISDSIVPLVSEPNDTSVLFSSSSALVDFPVRAPSSLGNLGKNFLGRSTGSVFGRFGTLLSQSVLQDEVGRVHTKEVVKRSNRTTAAATSQPSAAPGHTAPALSSAHDLFSAPSAVITDSSAQHLLSAPSAVITDSS